MVSMGGSLGRSKSVPIDVTPTDVAAYRNQTFQNVTNFLANIGVDPKEFETNAKAFTADLTQGFQDALTSARRAAAPTSAERTAQGFLTGLLNGSDALDVNNPIVQAALDAATRPILLKGQEDEARLRSLIAGSGQTLNASSPFAAAFARLQEGTGANVAAARSGILFPLLQTDANRRLAAVSASTDLANTLASRVSNLANLELVPTQVQQQGITSALQELDARRQTVSAILAAALGATQPIIANASKSDQKSGQFSIFGG